jgi:hypothetical protein
MKFTDDAHLVARLVEKMKAASAGVSPSVPFHHMHLLPMLNAGLAAAAAATAAKLGCHHDFCCCSARRCCRFFQEPTLSGWAIPLYMTMLKEKIRIKLQHDYDIQSPQRDSIIATRKFTASKLRTAIVTQLIKRMMKLFTSTNNNRKERKRKMIVMAAALS